MSTLCSSPTGSNTASPPRPAAGQAEALYEKIHRWVRKLARQRAARCHLLDPEDLFQEAWTVLLERLGDERTHRYPGKAAIFAVDRAARRLAGRCRNDRSRLNLLRRPESLKFDTADARPPFEAELDQLDFAEIALARLAPLERNAVEVRFGFASERFRGEAVRFGSRGGVTNGTLLMHACAGLAHLREEFGANPILSRPRPRRARPNQPCLRCEANIGSAGRGLCRTCIRKPGMRDLYPAGRPGRKRPVV